MTLFSELAHLIVMVGKSEIHRAGQQAEHSGRVGAIVLKQNFFSEAFSFCSSGFFSLLDKADSSYK